MAMYASVTLVHEEKIVGRFYFASSLPFYLKSCNLAFVAEGR